MPADALDMALDDLVQGGDKKGRGRGRGKAGGKGFRSTFKGGSKGSSKGGRGKGWRSKGGDDEAPAASGAKLDMALEDVIEKDKGKGKGGKESRKGKGKGKRSKGDWGKDSYSGGGGYSDRGNSWGDRGDRGYSKGGGGGYDRYDSYDRKGSKGYSKGGGYGGRGSFDPDDRAAQWNQHDDRADDEDHDSRGGKGFGWGSSAPQRGGKGDRDRLQGRVRSENVRGDDGWQRVEQPSRPALREGRRGVRDEGRREPGGRGKVADARAPATKRGREEAVDARTAKAVKVTNIPRDVNMDDIKDAFEADTGTIIRCRLDRGTAWIAFARTSDARKAVETFDRGELNGQQIGVVLDA